MPSIRTLSFGWQSDTIIDATYPDSQEPNMTHHEHSVATTAASYTIAASGKVVVEFAAGNEPTVTGDGEYSTTASTLGIVDVKLTSKTVDPSGKVTWVGFRRIYGGEAYTYKLGGSTAADGMDGQTLAWAGGATQSWSEGTPPPMDIPPPQVDDFEAGLDKLQEYLDYAGMVPLIGEAADILNAGIHLGRGNYLEAGVSIVSMVPFGDALKVFRKGGEVVGGSKALVQNLTKQSGELSTALNKTNLKCVDGLNCFVAGTQVVTAVSSDSPIAVALEVPADDSASLALIGAGLGIAALRYRLNRRKQSDSVR